MKYDDSEALPGALPTEKDVEKSIYGSIPRNSGYFSKKLYAPEERRPSATLIEAFHTHVKVRILPIDGTSIGELREDDSENIASEGNGGFKIMLGELSRLLRTPAPKTTKITAGGAEEPY